MQVFYFILFFFQKSYENCHPQALGLVPDFEIEISLSPSIFLRFALSHELLLQLTAFGQEHTNPDCCFTILEGKNNWFYFSFCDCSRIKKTGILKGDCSVSKGKAETKEAKKKCQAKWHQPCLGLQFCANKQRWHSRSQSIKRGNVTFI